MATRVTSVRDQLRTAFTERSGGRSVCASSVIAEIASAAISFIPWRSSRDVLHRAVRPGHFLNMSRRGGRQILGFLVWRSRGPGIRGPGMRGPYKVLPDQDQVIPRLGVRRYAAVLRHRAFTG